MASVLRGMTLTKNKQITQTTIHWKQGSVLGIGGDCSQSYNVFEYCGPNGDVILVYVQQSFGAPQKLTVDGKLQYGMNDGVFFLVLHEKTQTPYQHRFIQNIGQKAAYAANALLKAYTGGIVDASWCMGDYLRDFWIHSPINLAAQVKANDTSNA